MNDAESQDAVLRAWAEAKGMISSLQDQLAAAEAQMATIKAASGMNFIVGIMAAVAFGMAAYAIKQSGA